MRPALHFSGIAELQYTQLTLRAVENRVARVKADAAYDLAVIDPYGGMIEWVADDDAGQAVLVTDVPLGTGNTYYSRLGDWVGWLSLVGMVLVMVPNPLLNPRR